MCIVPIFLIVVLYMNNGTIYTSKQKKRIFREKYRLQLGGLETDSNLWEFFLFFWFSICLQGKKKLENFRRRSFLFLSVYLQKLREKITANYGLKWILWHSRIDRIFCFDNFIDRRHAGVSWFIETVGDSWCDWPCKRSRSFDWPSHEVKFMEVLSVEPDDCS